MWVISHSQTLRITFKKPIGSVTVSGHKFLGCPIPCGIAITRLEYINALSKNVEIIASRDATITGSRCGHAPIFLWYALKKRGLIYRTPKRSAKMHNESTVFTKSTT